MNPACKQCGGRTIKSGFHRDGRRRYLCKESRHTTLEYYLEKPPRKPCPACGGRLHLAGLRHERQAYLCYDCGKFHIEGPSLANVTRSTSNLYCVACHGLMVISGQDRKGQRLFTCKACEVTYFPFARRRSPRPSDVYCVACRLPMKRAGHSKGRQRFSCRKCKAGYRDGTSQRAKAAPPPVPIITTGANPPCKHCGGRTMRDGRRRGWQQLKCLECGKQFQVAPFTTTSAKRSTSGLYCVTCHNPMRAHGRDRGRQYFACRECKTHYLASRRERPPLIQNNPWCVTCHAVMHKRGRQNGRQYFYCRKCKTYYRDGRGSKSAPLATGTTIRQARKQEAAQLDAKLLDAIREALPGSLPRDLRDDITQEMAVAALDGALDLADLKNQVATYRRRINQLSANRWQFVSLSQPIPGTNGLTYGETIAG